MKAINKAILVCILALCSVTDSSAQSFCGNELALLNYSSPISANFDFSLNYVDEFKQLQEQIDSSLCSKVVAFKGQFHFQDIDIESIKARIISEAYCVDTTQPTTNIPPCILIRSTTVLINKAGQILFDGALIDLDEVGAKSQEVCMDFFWKNEFRNVAFEIIWDHHSPIAVREQVFIYVIQGYLAAANDLALKTYNKKTCDLSITDLDDLKSKFMFALLVHDRISPPLPPPPHQKYRLDIDDEAEFEAD